MGNPAKAVLVLLLLAVTVAAKNASMPVPAVVLLGGGELVQVEVEIRDGHGGVYVSTDPLVGVQTQDSAKTAFKVAGDMSGVNLGSYDVLVRLKDYGNTKSVDGPSGGAAMTLLMLSILENKTVRGDLTVTGTISADKKIGEVGEVGKKTKAAADAGLRVMLIPKSYDTFDKMVLSILGSRWNIAIIEVDNMNDVANLAFSPESTILSSNVMEVKPKAKANLTVTEINCTDCYIDEFKALAEEMMQGNRALSAEIRESNRSEFSYFLNAIDSDIGQADDAEGLNYVYSGANSAFLTSVDLNFLENSNVTLTTLQTRMLDVEGCINSTSRATMTKENFEWVAGGDERLAWSRKKMNDVEGQNYSDDEETSLFIFKEVLTAETWCNISHEMFRIADKIGGTPVDESRLKALASSRIAEGNDKVKSFVGLELGDAAWRFEAAKNEFGNGSFAAAIFDSDYLLSTIDIINSTNDVEGYASSEFNTSKSWDGMWAALYGNHAEYLYLISKQGSGSMGSSVLLSVYAKNLNGDTVSMKGLFEGIEPVESNNGGITVTEQPQYEEELALLLVVCLISAIFLNIVQFFRTAE
ncbi:MAG: hypothetical protein NT130_04200 [Candidatus Micrarchaeota archaeon]|nr:hypothetical protein [Candidatus Micrarchaeota archaeon]